MSAQPAARSSPVGGIAVKRTKKWPASVAECARGLRRAPEDCGERPRFAEGARGLRSAPATRGRRMSGCGAELESSATNKSFRRRIGVSGARGEAPATNKDLRRTMRTSRDAGAFPGTNKRLGRSGRWSGDEFRLLARRMLNSVGCPSEAALLPCYRPLLLATSRSVATVRLRGGKTSLTAFWT